MNKDDTVFSWDRIVHIKQFAYMNYVGFHNETYLYF